MEGRKTCVVVGGGEEGRKKEELEELEGRF